MTGGSLPSLRRASGGARFFSRGLYPFSAAEPADRLAKQDANFPRNGGIGRWTARSGD